METIDKSILYQKCLDYVEQRLAHAQGALFDAKQAGEEETKSTVGDKHETGKAMAQLEQEKALLQLHEATELKNSLSKIDSNKHTDRVALGSLVITNKANFYIAIAAGKIEIENQTFYAISPESPIGHKLMGLPINQHIVYNANTYEIEKLI